LIKDCRILAALSSILGLIDAERLDPCGPILVIIIEDVINIPWKCTNHIYIGAVHIMSGLIGGSIGFGLPQSLNIGFDSYCCNLIKDCRIVASWFPNCSIIDLILDWLILDCRIIAALSSILGSVDLFIMDLYYSQFIYHYRVIYITPAEIMELPNISKYLFDISQYILLPLYSFVRLFVYSFDVIHTLGIYSWGVKIDAIPGRINVATTLRLLNKGEYRGKCFELCGQGHLSMAIVGLVLN